MFEDMIPVIAIMFVLGGALIGFYYIIVVPSRRIHINELLLNAKHTDAIILLKDIVKKEPFNNKALFELAEVYWSIEDYQEAIHIYQQIINRNIPIEMYETVSVRLAHWNFKQKQFASAKTALENLLKKNPQQIECLSLLGDIYFEHKDFQESISMYKKALNLDRENLHCWKNISKSYFNLKMYMDAYKSYAHAINIDQKDAELWYYAAESYFLSKDYDKAHRFFSKTEQLIGSPYSFKALIKLSDIYRIKEDVEEYTKILEKARSIIQRGDSLFDIEKREILEIHYRLGEIYSQNNHMELALLEWKQILSIDPFFKDISKKYRTYHSEFVSDLFKDMLTTRDEELSVILLNFLKSLNYEIDTIQQVSDVSIDFYVDDLLSTKHQKDKTIISFWCSAEPLPDDIIAHLRIQISKNIIKGMVISASPILSRIKELSQDTMIEFYDQTSLENLIHERKNT